MPQSAEGNPMNYPSAEADSLESFVRKTFRLPPRAQNLYCGLRWLEKSKLGFCKPVCAGFRDISEEAGIGIGFVKPALLDLQEKGLIHLEIGSPIKAKKKATSIQRLTLDEVKTRTTQGDHSCHRLAQALYARPALLFNGIAVKPSWSVAGTGRVMSSGPNIQGMPGAERIAGLQSGLTQGQVLVDADIKQADPTVIKSLIGIPLERDLYQEYANVSGCSRDDAKKPVNTLAYCLRLDGYFGHLSKPAQAVLRDYYTALKIYRTTLFAEARRQHGITTMTGRFMNAVPGKRLHAGKVLCWRVQGTVADIISAACLRLLDIATVVMPVHDAILAILPTERAGIVAGTIQDEAHKIGLTVRVKVQEYTR
jgi:hypothetical protein